MKRRPERLSLIERALVEQRWHATAIDAQIHAAIGEDSDRLVNSAGRILYVVLGACIAEDVDHDMPEVRIIRGAVNAVHDQAEVAEIPAQRRASIVAGLEAAGRLVPALAPQPHRRGVRPHVEAAPPRHAPERLRGAAEMKTGDTTIGAATLDWLMTLARLGPGYVGHVRHRARELEKDNDFGWYTGLAACVDEALQAEGIPIPQPTKVSNEEFTPRNIEDSGERAAPLVPGGGERPQDSVGRRNLLRAAGRR